MTLNIKLESPELRGKKVQIALISAVFVLVLVLLALSR